MRTKSGLILAVPALFLILTVPGRAQWLTQEIALVPGWNAIYLEVQPEPNRCEWVFRNAPVQSVWKWNRRFSSIQFDIEPSRLLPENPDWLMWLPSSDPRSFLNRLTGLEGCKAYLVKVSSNAAPFTLSVKGRVIKPRRDWYPHGLNLVGFPVHPRNPPTFAEFFKFTPEIDASKGYANELFRLDAAGRGQRIVQPARERIAPGVAYWVGCARAPDGTAALEITSPAASVDFGEMLTEQDVHVRNLHPSAILVVILRVKDSEPPPAGYPELAGPVPLSVLQREADGQMTWSHFPVNGFSQALSPGQEWVVHLGVRRQNLSPYTPQGTNGAAYQSILEVSDANESLLAHVPLVVVRPNVLTATETLSTHSPVEGLWVGQATINQVNAPAYTTNQLLSAPAPASFRLLVHIDGANQARLLQEAVLAWDNSLTNAANTNGGFNVYSNSRTVPAEAGYVLRISSAAFPVMPPVRLSGSVSNALNGTVTIKGDDPTNPFLHRYHPLHDNRDWKFRPYTNAVETREITRNLELQFLPATNTPANPYWGVSALRGTYQETILGLRADPILLQGAFVLERINQINTLQ